eukprot:365123-Chlamydomonas_euryale.AAC.3
MRLRDGRAGHTFAFFAALLNAPDRPLGSGPTASTASVERAGRLQPRILRCSPQSELHNLPTTECTSRHVRTRNTTPACSTLPALRKTQQLAAALVGAQGERLIGYSGRRFGADVP